MSFLQEKCSFGIFTPLKKQKNKMTTAEYIGMVTSAASVATMMVTIANIIK